MMIFLLAGLLWLIPVSGWAAVSYDISTTQQAASGTSDSFSHVIGSGSNVYVFACAMTRNATTAADVTSMTIGGSAATHLVTANDATDGVNIRVEMWGRAMGSTNGSVTVATNWDRTDAPRIVATSLFGVDQATPVGTTQSVDGNNTFPTSLSVNVTSAANELVASCLGTATSAASITVGAGQTQRWLNTSTAANSTQDQGSTEPGGATVTMSHSWTTPDYAALVAAPFKAAGTGGTACRRMLMGVGC